MEEHTQAYQTFVLSVVYLEIIADDFQMSSNDMFYSCAAEETFSDHGDFYIPEEEIPADANIDDALWWF